MTRLDLFESGRGAQPRGKRLLAGFGARDRQQLEQRCRAEEVQVPRIGMIGGETGAVGATALPGALDALEAAAVQIARPRRPLVLQQHSRMDCRQPREGHDRRNEPPPGQRVTFDGEPRRSHANRDHQQPQVRNQPVRAIASGDRVGPAGDALLVLGAWLRHVRRRAPAVRGRS
jgi:hypothetical protein